MNLSDFDWRKAVNLIAPSLGLAIGGPLGGMAGKLVAVAVGAKEGATDSDLNAALSDPTPEQIIALRQANIEFEKFLADNDLKLEEVAAADRANARAALVESKSHVPQALTAGLVGAFVATVLLLVFYEIPVTNKDIIVYMIGQLSGSFTAAVAFWFGTTRESSRKTELLAQSAPAR